MMSERSAPENHFLFTRHNTITKPPWIRKAFEVQLEIGRDVGMAVLFLLEKLLLERRDDRFSRACDHGLTIAALPAAARGSGGSGR